MRRGWQVRHPALAALRVKYGEMDGIRRAGTGAVEGSGAAQPLSTDLRKLRLVLVNGNGGGSGADIFDERDGAHSLWAISTA